MRRSDSLFETLIHTITLTSPQRARRGPENEEAGFLHRALQAVATFGLVGGITYTAISIALPSISWFVVVVTAAMAIIIATLVVLLDLHIIDAAETEAAHAEIAAGRYQPFRRNRAALWSRIILAVLLSGTMGMFLDLKIFEQEILKEAASRHAASNAVLERETRQALATELGELASERATLIEDRKGIAKRIAAVEDHGDTDLARLAGELTAGQGGVAALDAKIAELSKQRAQTEQSETLEKGGVKVEGRTTGRAGCGPQCQLIQSELKRIDTEMAAVEGQRREVQTRIKAIEAEQQRRQPEAKAEVGNKLNDMRSLMTARETRLDDIERKLATSRDDMQAAIKTRMQSDPRYVAIEDGLAARFAIMGDMMANNPKMILPVVAVALTMIALELNLILIHAVFPKRSIYALLTATDYLKTLERAVDGSLDSIYIPPPVFRIVPAADGQPSQTHYEVEQMMPGDPPDSTLEHVSETTPEPTPDAPIADRPQPPKQSFDVPEDPHDALREAIDRAFASLDIDFDPKKVN